MIKRILLGITLFYSCFNLGFGLDASVSYAIFQSPETSYIEVYLHLAGKSVTFNETPDSSFQAATEVVILFQQDSTIVKYDKFVLNSPISKKPIDFIDLKRYALNPGQYDLIVAVRDMSAPENRSDFSTQLDIQFNADNLHQSDLQLLASFDKAEDVTPFTKVGYNLEPLPYNFYGRRASTLIFYNELYGADQFIGDDFLVSYSIERLINGESSTVMIGHKRQKPKAIIPLLMQMDISKLESGNYSLVVEVRDRNQTLLNRKSVFFQRSNPYLDYENINTDSLDLKEEFVQKLSKEQLEYSLRALTPHLPQEDVAMVNSFIQEGKLDAQRLYLFNFWVRENATGAAYAYEKYMEVVGAIDKLFESGFRHGFETDRGYVYLKYGQPDDIQHQEEEPSAPPYEIWSYYEFPATRQNNVKFIFYNPSLAPGDYVLLHSTAIGELNNPQWQLQLYKNAPNEVSGDPFDATQMQDNFNRNASRYFRDY